MIYLLIAVAVILVIVVRTRPESFRIERSIHIDAPSERVFPLVSDFHQWRRWSPFEDIDPDLTRTYEGPAGSVGAVYTWSGNSQAGAGRMEIFESDPPSHVRVRQEFTRPFRMDSTVEFLLSPETSGTRITWAMFGRNSGMSKVMGLFMNMDRIMGKEFDKGLARLKAAAEGERQAGTSSEPLP